MGNEISIPEGPLQVPDHVARIGFPPTVYLKWLKHPTALVFGVSREKGGRPVYNLCMPRGWGGPIILFPGETCKADAICVAEREGKRFTIHLPGVPTYGLAPCKATLISDHPDKEVRYAFTVGVGNGYGQHNEAFEWRRSAGPEIKALGGAGSGFKLLRVASTSTPAPSSHMPPPYQSSVSGLNHQTYNNNASSTKAWNDWAPPLPPRSSTALHQQSGAAFAEYLSVGALGRSNTGFSMNGKEVVAVFGEEKGWSMSKIGAFQFLGSGNSPEFGYHASLMSFFSAMVLYQYENAMANGETGASGAGATVGAVVSIVT